MLPLSFDPVFVADFDRKGRAALDILDAHLSSHRFLVVGEATTADICCYAGVAFTRLGNKDLAAWQNVIAWARRIEAFHGFTETLDLLPMQDAEITSEWIGTNL